MLWSYYHASLNQFFFEKPCVRGLRPGKTQSSLLSTIFKAVSESVPTDARIYKVFYDVAHDLMTYLDNITTFDVSRSFDIFLLTST